MRRHFVVALALGLAAGTLVTPATAAFTPSKIERRLTGPGVLSAFVTFDHPVRDADLARLRTLGITKMHRFRLIPTVAVQASLATLRRVASWRDVTTLRRDDPVRFLTDESKKAVRVDKARAKKPAGLGLTGAGVTVAVIDTGFDQTHPDFDGRIAKLLNFEGSWIWDNPDDGTQSDRLAEETGPYAGMDESGHGSHVAGTVLGTAKAAMDGVDYTGMAPGAKLVGMKVAGAVQSAQDIGWEINCMIAIEYAAEHAQELGIRVVSNSWSIYEVDDPRTEPIILMVDAAVRTGLTFAFAAGNSGRDGDESVVWPGALGSVITVASTTKAEDHPRSSFSSQGYQVDIAAPGSDIWSVRSRSGLPTAALDAQDGGANAANYTAFSGTSMATPHVAGIAALMFEANKRLTPALVSEIIERTAVDLGDRGKDHEYGYGFIDAYRAAQVAACLARTPTARRESCFAAVKALPRSKWASDFSDPGDRSGTDQGGGLPPV